MKVHEAMSFATKWFEELEIVTEDGTTLKRTREVVEPKFRGDNPDPGKTLCWSYTAPGAVLAEKIELTIRFVQNHPLDFKAVQETKQVPYHCEAIIGLQGRSSDADTLLARISKIRTVAEAALKFERCVNGYRPFLPLDDD